MQRTEAAMSGIIWIVVVGFVAGIIARFLSRGPNNPTGFMLTVVLGIAGAFLATLIGQAIGWYRPDQGAGFVMATIGALACSSSGTGSWCAASSRIRALTAPVTRRQSWACSTFSTACRTDRAARAAAAGAFAAAACRPG